LPKRSYAIICPETKITKNYDTIKLKVEQLLAYEISVDEYLEVLDNIYSKLEETANTVSSMEIPEDLMPYFKEQIEIGLTGIDMFLQAINELRVLAELVKELDETKSEEVRQNLLQKIKKIKEQGLGLAAEAIERLNIASNMAIKNMIKWKAKEN